MSRNCSTDGALHTLCDCDAGDFAISGGGGGNGLALEQNRNASTNGFGTANQWLVVCETNGMPGSRAMCSETFAMCLDQTP